MGLVSNSVARSARQVGAIAALICAGVGAFVAVAYLPTTLTSSQTTQAATGMALRAIGFGCFLGAGSLVVRLRRPAGQRTWER